MEEYNSIQSFHNKAFIMPKIQAKIIQYTKLKKKTQKNGFILENGGWLWHDPDVRITDNYLKTAIITVSNDVKENMLIMNEKIGILSQEIETIGIK